MKDGESLAKIYWTLTLPLLVLFLMGWPYAWGLTLLLTLFQLLHFYWREKSIMAFAVQVRLVFVILVGASLFPGFQWIAWAQFIGLSIRTLFDYCFLARSVSLLPWNLRAPLTWQRFVRTFASPPVKGSILQGAQKN